MSNAPKTDAEVARRTGRAFAQELYNRGGPLIPESSDAAEILEGLVEAALAEARRQEKERAGWQPIETVAEGERLLLWVPLLGVLPGPSKRSGECRPDGTTGTWICTHWKPMPEPPAPPLSREEPNRGEV